MRILWTQCSDRLWLLAIWLNSCSKLRYSRTTKKSPICQNSDSTNKAGANKQFHVHSWAPYPKPDQHPDYTRISSAVRIERCESSCFEPTGKNPTLCSPRTREQLYKYKDFVISEDNFWLSDFPAFSPEQFLSQFGSGFSTPSNNKTTGAKFQIRNWKQQIIVI